MNEETRRIIDAILESGDAREAVRYAVEGYAKKSVENARDMIKLISVLSDIALSNKQEEVKRNREASFWLMVQIETAMYDKALFSSMLPVCMACFPSGKNEGNCEAEKRYFNRFLELFKNKNTFSWEKDKIWADYFKYTDYLKLVEENMKNG